MAEPNVFDPIPPSPQAVEIVFLLEEHGSASLSVQCGTASTTIGSFGYCTDALPDLLRAALAVTTGAIYAEVIFDGEPQLWGLVLEQVCRSPANELVFRLRLMGRGEDTMLPGGQLLPVWEWQTRLLEGYVTSESFGRAMERAAQATLGEFGERGYRERWGYPRSLEGFPLRALNALRAALATPEVRAECQ